MRPKKLRLDDQLCFSLYAATNAVTRAYRPLLGKLGLTYPQYLVMLVLWQDGSCTIGHIAQRLSLAQNAITPLVDRLEDADFLERKRDTGDRRVVGVRLTKAGKDLRATASLAQQAVECRTMLGPEKLNALRDELFELVRRMESDEHENPNRRQPEMHPET